MDFGKKRRLYTGSFQNKDFGKIQETDSSPSQEKKKIAFDEKRNETISFSPHASVFNQETMQKMNRIFMFTGQNKPNVHERMTNVFQKHSEKNTAEIFEPKYPNEEKKDKEKCFGNLSSRRASDCPASENLKNMESIWKEKKAEEKNFSDKKDSFIELEMKIANLEIQVPLEPKEKDEKISKTDRSHRPTSQGFFYEPIRSSKRQENLSVKGDLSKWVEKTVTDYSVSPPSNGGLFESKNFKGNWSGRSALNQRLFTEKEESEKEENFTQRTMTQEDRKAKGEENPKREIGLEEMSPVVQKYFSQKIRQRRERQMLGINDR